MTKPSFDDYVVKGISLREKEWFYKSIRKSSNWVLNSFQGKEENSIVPTMINDLSSQKARKPNTEVSKDTVFHFMSEHQGPRICSLCSNRTPAKRVRKKVIVSVEDPV